MDIGDDNWSIRDTSALKDLLRTHPKALLVLLDRGVPALCAEGTVADAAHACGLPTATLLAELKSVVDGESACRKSNERDSQS